MTVYLAHNLMMNVLIVIIEKEMSNFLVLLVMPWNILLVVIKKKS